MRIAAFFNLRQARLIVTCFFLVIAGYVFFTAEARDGHHSSIDLNILVEPPLEPKWKERVFNNPIRLKLSDPKENHILAHPATLVDDVKNFDRPSEESQDRKPLLNPIVQTTISTSVTESRDHKQTLSVSSSASEIRINDNYFGNLVSTNTAVSVFTTTASRREMDAVLFTSSILMVTPKILPSIPKENIGFGAKSLKVRPNPEREYMPRVDITTISTTFRQRAPEIFKLLDMELREYDSEKPQMTGERVRLVLRVLEIWEDINMAGTMGGTAHFDWVAHTSRVRNLMAAVERVDKKKFGYVKMWYML